MENITFLSGQVTPEVAVLLRATLVTAAIFGLEALSNARRRLSREAVKRAQLSKKQTVRA